MIENGRAQFAYDQIQNIESNKVEEYTSHVKQIPMLIKNNGLAQALVFSVGKNEKKAIYEHINAWLLDKQQKERFDIPRDTRDVIDFIVRTDSSTYRQMTTEVMAYLEWLKRFAEGRKVGEKLG